MTQIAITEFRNNIKKYSEMAKEQDLEIVNRGEVMFVVKSPKSNKRDAFNALMGAARSEANYKDILKEKANEL
jgi:hypothetical protein